MTQQRSPELCLNGLGPKLNTLRGEDRSGRERTLSPRFGQRSGRALGRAHQSEQRSPRYRPAPRAGRKVAKARIEDLSSPDEVIEAAHDFGSQEAPPASDLREPATPARCWC